MLGEGIVRFCLGCCSCHKGSGKGQAKFGHKPAEDGSVYEGPSRGQLIQESNSSLPAPLGSTSEEGIGCQLQTACKKSGLQQNLPAAFGRDFEGGDNLYFSAGVGIKGDSKERHRFPLSQLPVL